MCGQLGYSGKEPCDIEKIKILLLWNSLERGEDSTGLYSPENGLIKTIKKGADFIIDNEIKPDLIMMAHARAKTIGAASANNAHPFKRGNWILQHNGTLSNYWDLRVKYNLDFKEYDVDSDILCGSLNAKDDLKVLKEINGPAAVLITNTERPNILIAFRNSLRPLYRGLINGNMYISSIENSLKLIGCTKIKEFKEDTIYYIIDGKIVNTVTIKNTPYAKNYINNTNIRASISHTGYEWGLNCWLRPTSSMCISGLDLKPNLYYYVKELLDVNNYKQYIIYDPVTKKEVSIYYGNFLAEDLIYKNTLVKTLDDIYFKSDNTLALKKGEICLVDTVYEDETVSLSNPNTNVQLVTLHKRFVVALTKEEALEFNNKNSTVESDEEKYQKLLFDFEKDAQIDYTVDDSDSDSEHEAANNLPIVVNNGIERLPFDTDDEQSDDDEQTEEVEDDDITKFYDFIKKQTEELNELYILTKHEDLEQSLKNKIASLLSESNTVLDKITTVLTD